MNGPERDTKPFRLKSAETRRWRQLDVDAGLDHEVLQHLNDLAFLSGVEIVSVCEGHAAMGEDGFLARQRMFAEVCFAAFYPHEFRLEAQRARLCIEAVAAAIAGSETVVAANYDELVDPERPRGRRLGRSLLAARRAEPTTADPAAAQAWWHEVVSRLKPRVPGS